MLKGNSKETLADRIAGVLHTTPASFDPEDEDFDNTGAQVEAKLSDDNEDVEEILSKLRTQNVDLLGDVDERYAGKKGSRRSLYESSESEQSEVDAAEESEVDAVENESKGSTEQSEAENSEDEEDDGSENESEDLENSVVTKEKDSFKHMNDGDVSSQVKKGLSVRNQMRMWESLLETRIQLQKCLITANKMPQTKTCSEIRKQSGQEFTNQVAITKNSLDTVLDKLLYLQKLVLKKYPETKNLSKVKEKAANEGDEEEIASDTEDEKSADESEDDKSEIPMKKRKLNDLEKEIKEQHDRYKNYRNGVIQKWHEKTKIAVMKNNANSHSVINHIEHTLSDRPKLIKRTQLKRSEYTILGQAPAEQSQEQHEDPQAVKCTEEYNPEIFDDDDFYHQLLRELIEVKSADLTDPVQLGRQWIQLQNLRSKMKRKIDTRATKGRKIRYAIHTKLVNFMAPIDYCHWTDEAKTELYNSLFGKKTQ